MNCTESQQTGAWPLKKQIKLTWKFIPEPTPLQLAAARETQVAATAQ